MDNTINITAPISACERTGLPRVARFTDLSIHANGSVHANYVEDTLDNNGETFLPGQEIKTIAHNPWEDDEPTAQVSALVTAIKPKLTNILKTLNQEGGEE